MLSGKFQFASVLAAALLLLGRQAAADQADADSVEDLPVPGYLPALVAVPSAAGRRPIIVATHGSFDRPEWVCQSWREIVGDAAFILCPRGILR